MTHAQLAGLASAILGAIGTVVLFFNSYALQPFQGGIFGSDALTASNNAVRTTARSLWCDSASASHSSV